MVSWGKVVTWAAYQLPRRKTDLSDSGIVQGDAGDVEQQEGETQRDCEGAFKVEAQTM